ncbi:hypothetical protein E2C01_093968 [Portunus trituberculatus]|uniref:Uncharacterized protein n=1 Tax=Portunus trituberculatus TaxID=210409 RepID=A0A5B7K1V7_PORTR|nr:hypothetical protein [Portunus trituberculatus]
MCRRRMWGITAVRWTRRLPWCWTRR